MSTLSLASFPKKTDTLTEWRLRPASFTPRQTTAESHSHTWQQWAYCEMPNWGCKAKNWGCNCTPCSNVEPPLPAAHTHPAPTPSASRYRLGAYGASVLIGAIIKSSG